jgi:16S rRNA (cytidine1402-2'-O)-methyltransferase
METCLYLIATPIGNLEDITLRAIETLKVVDLIACEDISTSKKLLANFGIKKKLIAIHQHNEKDKAEFLINEMANGKSIAYISDAGTPAISDPGAFLVNQALKLGLNVSPIPGPSSLVAAFSVSGIESTQFQFYGFLPNASSKAKKLLKTIYNQPLPTIIFESPHRILKTLSLVRDIFGANHEIFVARELTKIYETIYKENVLSIIDRLESYPKEQKGEFVIILTSPVKEAEENDVLPINEALTLLLKELPLKQSVKLISSIFKKNKKEVYNQALELKND